MKVGIITTLNHNIGDDFVRAGIINILESLMRGMSIEYVLVNKHDPLEVYPSLHPLRWVAEVAGRLPWGRRRVERHAEELLYKCGKSRFQDCDFIIQSGAPVLFDGCADAEWTVPLWEHIIGRLFNRITVLNLAAGSCYSWKNSPREVSNDRDAAFLRRIAAYCRLTTVRETLAHRLMGRLGVETHLLPCTAFLSGMDTINSSTSTSPIYINYMEGAGHYNYGQNISGAGWLATLKTLLKRLEKRHTVRMLCHTKGEYLIARREFPENSAVFPKTIDDYLRVIATAKCGVYNRLHASIALGGIGVPSIGIGTDTRMLMLGEIGLPYRFVGAANVDDLENAVEVLLENRASEKERLLALRAQTWRRYCDLIGPLLPAF